MGLQEKWLRGHTFDDAFWRESDTPIPGSSTRTLEPGEYLFHEGEPSHEMYLVLSGRLIIFQGRGVTAVTLAELEPPEFIGEMGCLQGEPRSANAVAMEESRVLVIPEHEVDRVVATLPRWLVRLIDTLITRLRDTDRRVKENA